uniref:Uncharacterized protein n=1 Tax=Utricularia reniformis TaxID=192314 RepID=A0A1Y0B0X0_9LAMI|nr:hypothetical protein AEK19_MT0779 [Utricularia reniformis]ART31021.1 hypothetical protein AEK19_MT0779 [Utricularia reniformis]
MLSLAPFSRPLQLTNQKHSNGRIQEFSTRFSFSLLVSLLYPFLYYTLSTQPYRIPRMPSSNLPATTQPVASASVEGTTPQTHLITEALGQRISFHFITSTPVFDLALHPSLEFTRNPGDQAPSPATHSIVQSRSIAKEKAVQADTGRARSRYRLIGGLNP